MRKFIRGLVVVLVLASPIVFAARQGAVADDKKDKAQPTTAVFEVYKDKGGEYRFRLKDAEGNLLAIAGKGYDKKADCQKVIETIKKDAPKAKVEEEK
jgi:uncharacterized protein YegP (UPF0339 family)